MLSLAESTQSIVNIMTLGYDSDKVSLLPPLAPADFNHDFYINGDSFNPRAQDLYKLIKDSIENKIAEIRAKRIVVATGGGIDSNVVLCIAKDVCRERSLDLSSISLEYNSTVNETLAAKAIASKLDIKCQTKYVDSALGKLPFLISLVKEPRYKLYEYDAIEFGKTVGCDLYLTGDGGDEMFLGYVFRYKQFLDTMNYLLNTFPSITPEDKMRAYLWGHNRNWIPEQPLIFGPAVQFSWDSIYRRLRPYFDNVLDALEQIKMADYNGKLLHDFVETNNAFFKHLGVNGYCPLLSRTIREYATHHLTTYDQYDYESNTGKIPLINILKDRYPEVWKLILKEKSGFGIDIGSLWKNEARDMCKSIEHVISLGLINREWFKKAVWKADQGDARYQSKLPSILALELWLKQQR